MSESATREIMDTNQLAEYISMSPVTLRQWRWQGHGPPFIQRGRFIRYRKVDVDAWMDEARRSDDAARLADEVLP